MTVHTLMRDLPADAQDKRSMKPCDDRAFMYNRQKKENPMKRYVRTNEEGKKVIDYDLLDTAARINFIEEAIRFSFDVVLDLSNPNFSNAEKLEALNSLATEQASYAFYILTEDGDDVLVDRDTRQLWIEAVVSELQMRYRVSSIFVNICERYGERVVVELKDYQALNPEGEFLEDLGGIYEIIDGVKEEIAEAQPLSM